MYKARKPQLLSYDGSGSPLDTPNSSLARSPNGIFLSPISQNGLKKTVSSKKLATLMKTSTTKTLSTDHTNYEKGTEITNYYITQPRDRGAEDNGGVEVHEISRKLSISKPNSLSYFDLNSQLTLNTQDMSSNMSPTDGLPPFRYMNDSDLLRQEGYINASPHFSKFIKQNYLLGQIEKSKSSLSKELFYYPEQVEVNKKLKENAFNVFDDEEDVDSGIITVVPKKRYNVNLIEGRNTYFKFSCYKKKPTVKFKVEVSSGAFEIYISRSTRKPSINSYDYLYSVSDFEVNYEEGTNLKNIYFSIYATERLMLAFSCGFKSEKENYQDSLPAINQRVLLRKEKIKNKKKMYEFFSKDMTGEEHQKLKLLAESIKEERRLKFIRDVANYKNIIKENQLTASNYEVIKTVKIAETGYKRDQRIMHSKEKVKELALEEDKRKLYIYHRDDIKKVKQQWERDTRDYNHRKLVFTVNFLLTAALSSICKTVLDKKRATIFVKIIQRKHLERVVRLQRAIRNLLNKCRVEIKPEIVLNPVPVPMIEARHRARIYESLNQRACMVRSVQIETAEVKLANMLDDCIEPLGILVALDKYVDTVVTLQFAWRRWAPRVNSKVEKFCMYWMKYCQALVKEEKNKAKKSHILLIQDLAMPLVRKRGGEFIRKRLRTYVRNKGGFVDLIKSLNERRKSIVAQSLINGGQDEIVRIEEGPGPFITSVDGSDTLRSENSPLADNFQTSNKLVLKPTLEEMRAIYEGIVTTLKDENII